MNIKQTLNILKESNIKGYYFLRDAKAPLRKVAEFLLDNISTEIQEIGFKSNRGGGMIGINVGNKVQVWVHPKMIEVFKIGGPKSLDYATQKYENGYKEFANSNSKKTQKEAINYINSLINNTMNIIEHALAILAESNLAAEAKKLKISFDPSDESVVIDRKNIVSEIQKLAKEKPYAPAFKTMKIKNIASHFYMDGNILAMSAPSHKGNHFFSGSIDTKNLNLLSLKVQLMNNLKRGLVALKDIKNVANQNKADQISVYGM